MESKWLKEEEKDGGAKRDRTADLLNAIQALSQLSYSPTQAVQRSITMGQRTLSSYYFISSQINISLACTSKDHKL